MQGVDYMNYNDELHENNYIYYIHKDFRAHNVVPPNIDCLNHRSGNVRRNYVEILPLLPMSQYDIACACVAISHRPHAGAPPDAQTTKPKTDEANYHAGAPPDAQTTKPKTDEVNYQAGAPPDAQTTKPNADEANYHAGAPLDAQTTKMGEPSVTTGIQVPLPPTTGIRVPLPSTRDPSSPSNANEANYHAGASLTAQTTDTDSHDYDVNADKALEEEYNNYHAGAPPAVQTTDTDSHDYDVNEDEAPEEEYDNYNHNYNFSDNKGIPTGDRSGREGTIHDPGHTPAHDATTTTRRRPQGDLISNFTY
jgi:hypothetical protein